MPPYLALTAQASLWPKKGPLVLIGPWCSTALDESRSDVVLLPSPYKDSMTFIAAGQACESRYFAIADRVGAALAELVGRPFIAREWRILNRVWLNHAIQQLHDRHAYVDVARARLPEFHTSVLDPADYQVLRQTSDLEQLADDDWYNLQLFSIVLEHLGLTSCATAVRRDPAPLLMRNG